MPAAVAAKRTRKIIRSPKPPKPPGTELAIVSRGIERASAKALMTKPTPDHLTSIIKINRGIAAGLRGKA